MDIDWGARPTTALRKLTRRALEGPFEDLWDGLAGAGMLLALSGRIERAVELWKLAADPRTPRPSPGSVFGDGTMMCLAVAGGILDLPVGDPAPDSMEEPEHDEDLTRKVARHDAWCRAHATSDGWPSRPLPKGPLGGLEPVDVYRRALAACESVTTGFDQDGRLVWSWDNAAKADFWQAFAALLEGDVDLPEYQRADLLVLGADAAARDGDPAHVNRLLADYIERGRSSFKIEPDYLGGLFPLALSIVGGSLSGAFAMRDADVTSLMADLHEGLPLRLAALAAGEGLPAPRKKVTVEVEHDQFYLEPHHADEDVAYFLDPAAAERGLSLARGHTALATPAQTAECRLVVEESDRMPRRGKAVRMVAFPLEVRDTAGVFVRTVSDHGTRLRLEIPPGEHLIVARFLPKKAKRANADVGLREWTVRLTILPPGLADTGVLYDEKDGSG